MPHPAGTTAPLKQKKLVNLYRVPFLNVIYDCLFDGTPTMEQVNALIAAWAFIDAILITMAGSIMTTLDRGQAIDLREQVSDFVNQTQVKLLNGELVQPYDKFVIYSCVSFGLITSAVFMVIIMYLGMGTISFNTKDGRFSQKAFAAWWSWNRWLYVLLIVVSASGVALLVISICYCWAMQHGNTPEMLAQLIWYSDLGNYIFLVLLGVFCPMVALSGGLVARDQTFDNVAKALNFEEETVEDLFLAIGQQLGKSREQVVPLIRVLKEEHWLKTAADLAALDDHSWKRLNLPLMLELKIKEVLATEEPIFHQSRRLAYVPEEAPIAQPKGDSGDDVVPEPEPGDAATDVLPEVIPTEAHADAPAKPRTRGR